MPLFIVWGIFLLFLRTSSYKASGLEGEGKAWMCPMLLLVKSLMGFKPIRLCKAINQWQNTCWMCAAGDNGSCEGNGALLIGSTGGFYRS